MKNGVMACIVCLVRDEAALAALRPAWDALEARAVARAVAPSLYASHGYVSRAWQYLRQAGDELAVVVLREGDELRAVWPLVSQRQRAFGLPVRVLAPIGIWEGERPGILCDGDEDDAWAALWASLWRARRHWQGLDLRELDPDRWPVRHLRSQPGIRVQDVADTVTPWCALPRPAAPSEPVALTALSTDLRVDAVTDADGMGAAFERFLALDHLQAAAPGAAGRYRLGDDAARVAFYRSWLPALAARGQAQIGLLVNAAQEGRSSQARGAQDVAAVLRLRSGAGRVWLERHATEHPDWHAQSPAVALVRQMLAEPDGAIESDLLLPPDGSGRVEALRACHDQVRHTRRLRVWNLRSRLFALRWLGAR